MPRKNTPHVPPTPQRHHLHPRSQRHMRTLHRPTTMPQRSPRIPPNRHARSMGRTNITTTSRQTKRTRHQTKTTINLTNVGQPINLTPQTNPTHITKTRPQNLHRLLLTRRQTTRLQPTLPPQVGRYAREGIKRLA